MQEAASVLQAPPRCVESLPHNPKVSAQTSCFQPQKTLYLGFRPYVFLSPSHYSQSLDNLPGSISSVISGSFCCSLLVILLLDRVLCVVLCVCDVFLLRLLLMSCCLILVVHQFKTWSPLHSLLNTYFFTLSDIYIYICKSQLARSKVDCSCPCVAQGEAFFRFRNQ